MTTFATDRTISFERFGLRHGQMHSDNNGLPFAKNQWWFLTNGNRVCEIGYGDISQDDILRIAQLLNPGETVDTYNEYDGMNAKKKYKRPVELGMTPRITITCDDIRFPQDEARNDRIKEILMDSGN